MENYSYSYPETQNSSPRSREMDSENQSWDEPISNYKVKFMCSYGGKIQPRPHDNQLSYIGGDTKILSVDRNIRFAPFVAKLSGLCDYDVCFKYQLPGEDLDALISVTNDEDLEHMMLEYDRLFGASVKPARLRLFLFAVNPATSGAASFDSGSPKSDQQWFVEALNSVPTLPTVESSVPVVFGTAADSDFLFGMDRGASPVVVAAKLPEAVAAVPTPAVVTVVPVESQVRGDQVLSQAEIQRQINELQKMQTSSAQEQVVYQPKSDGSDNIRTYGGVADYYATQKIAENVVQAPQGGQMQMPMYWQDQSQMNPNGYQVTSGGPGAEQQVYIIPTPSGMYQPSTNYRQMPVQNPQPQIQSHAQAYYGTQRIVPEVYREQQIYTTIPPSIPQTIQQPTTIVYTEGMGGRQQTEGSYAVTYDGTGRQVYYTAAGGVTPTYQMVSNTAALATPAAQNAAINQEGKTAIVKPN